MREVVLMGLYESNARHLHQLSLKIKEKYGYDSIQLCIYNSSTNYCKKNRLNHINLPKSVRKFESRALNNDLNINSSYYSFHSKLFNKFDSQYESIAKQYFYYFTEIFDWSDIVSIVVIGDRRMYSSIPSSIAKRKGIKVLFFEPGPCGTMIFDPKGVNCNMSISSIQLDDMKKALSQDEIDKLYSEFITIKNIPKFYSKKLNAYINKIPDILQSVPPSYFRGVFYPELFTGEGFLESIPYLFSRIWKRKSKDIFFTKCKYIFIPLQVPYDVQIIENGGEYTNIESMVDSVINNLPHGYKVIIREHPMNKGRYKKSLYTSISNHPNASIDNESSIDELIDHSDLVVTINSTVGLEAALRGKAVLAMGKIYYHQIVNIILPRYDLKENIERSVNVTHEYSDIKAFIAFLYKFYLVKDNYKNNMYFNLDKLAELVC